MALPIAEFVRRWKLNSLSERQGAQSHFLDLCEMLGEAHPAAVDAVGERYCFEKPVPKEGGGKRFADVWYRDHFAWEYKGKHKDLKAAYRQLNDYREALENPPLLVVCDLDRFEVHTNFTATRKRVYAFDLDDLLRNVVTATCPLPPLDVLRALFGDYNVLRPERTDARVTQEAAKVFARLAERLEIEKRALTDTPIHTKEEIAHFLMRLLFCLFADSIGLLPDHIFRNLVMSDDRFRPKKFLRKLKDLFEAMSEADSTFGIHSIKYFNGGLFDSDAVIELDTGDLGTLYEAAKNYDWAHVAPEIFGTLFERSLNKERRSLIGAHYTSAEDILLLIEPVLMQPLERRWKQVRESVLVALAAEGAGAEETKGRQARLRTTEREAERLLSAWVDELTAVRVLDPACGSGNFLYIALRRMLDLWKEAHDFAVENDLKLAANYAIDHMVSPTQLYGIEIEFYAHELASIVVWIGYLQWKHEHGITEDREPILQKLSNIELVDAVMQYDRQGKAVEPDWPEVEYIVGNPPFLGDKRMRRELGSSYVDDLRRLYSDRVPGGADLVVYWFEKARAYALSRKKLRVGLIATQSIRGGLNRVVLERIADSGEIFWAQSDRNWLLDGAAVHVSMVAFHSGQEDRILLNGEEVAKIHPNLAAGANSASAQVLLENEGLCFIGTQKGGAFDLDPETARRMLAAPENPNGKANRLVVHPWQNASDVAGRSRGMHIIDFGVDMAMQDAALYQLPFEYVRKHVKAKREALLAEGDEDRWWLHQRPRPAFRERLSDQTRYAATPRHSKHRFFIWLSATVVPDSALAVVARSDDYMMGILLSRAHETWARAQGTQVRDVESGFRYTPQSCFDTFPFPWSPGTEPLETSSVRVRMIAETSRELVRLRNAWLNPPGRVESELHDRTLTNLYNERPEWLANAHRVLDRAVFAAYGWSEDPEQLPEQELLARLLALNHERAAAQPAKGKKAGRKRRATRDAAAPDGNADSLRE